MACTGYGKQRQKRICLQTQAMKNRQLVLSTCVLLQDSEDGWQSSAEGFAGGSHQRFSSIDGTTCSPLKMSWILYFFSPQADNLVYKTRFHSQLHSRIKHCLLYTEQEEQQESTIYTKKHTRVHVCLKECIFYIMDENFHMHFGRLKHT